MCKLNEAVKDHTDRLVEDFVIHVDEILIYIKAILKTNVRSLNV